MVEINLEELFKEVSILLEKEPRLIHLPRQGKAVFVGDTHGDLDSAEQVIHRYLKRSHKIVFLGDYVDRGEYSEENIRYLLKMKLKHPDEIFLLAGNHEGYMIKELYPANFWDSLSMEEKEAYGIIFSKFPLSATSENGILALHGGLPDLEFLEQMDQVELGSIHWDRIVWGDFMEGDSEVLVDWGGRPQLGRPYFERLMERFKKRILIRSHQPYAPLMMFNKRCITIFTSHAYLPIRTIVIVDLEKEIQTAEDLVIERI